MPNNTLRVVARIKARPETIDAVRQLLSGLIEPTRKETGCIAYELLQNKQDPTDFTFVEEWGGETVFKAHLATDHIQAALPKLQDLAVDPPDIRLYSLLG